MNGPRRVVPLRIPAEAGELLGKAAGFLDKVQRVAGAVDQGIGLGKATGAVLARSKLSAKVGADGLELEVELPDEAPPPSPRR